MTEQKRRLKPWNKLTMGEICKISQIIQKFQKDLEAEMTPEEHKSLEEIGVFSLTDKISRYRQEVRDMTNEDLLRLKIQADYIAEWDEHLSKIKFN